MSRFIYEFPRFIDDDFFWEKSSYLDKLEDRFKRIDDHKKMQREFATKRRPLLLMFHTRGPMDLFQKWTDVAYELADPKMLGKEMDFYVDNYVHLLKKQTSFIRGSDGCTSDRAPLIYGVTSQGEMHFFDRIGEPEEPNKDALLDFCQMVINGVRTYPNVEDIDMTRWNEIINSSNEDVVIFFYHGGFKPFMESFYRLGVLLKKDSVRLYTMNLDRGGVPINFPEVEGDWDMFFVKRGQRDNPVPYHRAGLYIWSMLKFVAKHSENELLFCDENGVLRKHGELLEYLESTLYIYESTDTSFSHRILLYFILMYKYIYNGDGYTRIER